MSVVDSTPSVCSSVTLEHRYGVYTCVVRVFFAKENAPQARILNEKKNAAGKAYQLQYAAGQIFETKSW